MTLFVRSLVRSLWRGCVVALAAGLTVCLTGALVGCSIKTAARRPRTAVEIPSKWTEASPVTGHTGHTGHPFSAEWWRQFGDSHLEALIDRARAENVQIGVAIARIDAARAGLRGAEALRAPEVQVAGGARLQRTPLADRGGRLPSELSALQEEPVSPRFTIGADVAYEVDLWRRRDAIAAAAHSEIAASVFDYCSAQLSVTSEVARQYVLLAELARRRDTSIELQRLAESRRLLVERLRADGLAFAESVLSSTREIAQLRAQQIQTETALRTAGHALSRLAGTPHDRVTPAPSLWTLRLPPIDAGLPSAVLASRPDVAAAEARLAAAAHRSQAAVRASFPDFSLTGSLGSASQTLIRLARGEAAAWSTVVGVDAPWFNRWRVRAAIESAESAEEVVYAEYRHAVVTALEEVETALAVLGGATSEEQSQLTLLETRERSQAVTKAQVAAGLRSRLDDLDASVLTVEARAALDRARAQRLHAVIDVGRAIGLGGCQPPGLEADAKPAAGPMRVK